MKIYIVKGLHPVNPGLREHLTFDPAEAERQAASMVDIIATDIDVPDTIRGRAKGWEALRDEALAWRWACEHGSTMTHGRNLIREVRDRGGDIIDEIGFNVWIEEDDVALPTRQVPVTVWTASADADGGTQGETFATEREGQEWIIGHLISEASMDGLDAHLAGGGEFWDYVDAHKCDPSLDTFNLDEKELLLDMPEREPVDVAVILDGGLVQHAVGRNAGAVNLFVVDYDVEGADEADLTDVPQDSGKLIPAAVRGEGIASEASPAFWKAVGAGEGPPPLATVARQPDAYTRYDISTPGGGLANCRAPLKIKSSALVMQPDEGPAGLVVDALMLLDTVDVAECFDRAQSGYFTLTDGRSFHFGVERYPSEGGEA